MRRELKIREGELYNETRKRESMENVKRLGYFDDVAFNSKTPSDNPDLMDIDITIKERNTGNHSAWRRLLDLFKVQLERADQPNQFVWSRTESRIDDSVQLRRSAV